MTKYLIKHLFEYGLVLVIILTAVLSVYLLPDSHLRRTTVIGVSALYPLWAISHHWKEGTLETTTILEYLAVTLLMAWTFLVVV